MSVQEVVHRINQSIHKLYHTNQQGRHSAIVCLICDRFISSNDICYITPDELQTNMHLFLPTSPGIYNDNLKKQYTISRTRYLSIAGFEVLKSCILSPRARYIKHRDRRKKSGFTTCTECSTHVARGTMPMFCTANNYAFGSTPTCLSELTQVELAMISPVKTFGYCFTYTGGKQKQLKGTLSYYKISTATIVRTGANLQRLGLNNHIIVLLYGKMTPVQKELAKKKYSINTGKIISAIKWLLVNNIKWQKYRVSFDEIVSSITCPIIVDNGHVLPDDSCPPLQNNIECTESFQVFYPDGTVSVSTGGQDNIEDFQEVIQEATKEGFQIECRMSIISEAVHDYKDNNLVNACLLQFPYGHGGLTDERVLGNSNIGTMSDILAYTTYLSMISLPQFHKELFTLQLYNMQLKFTMMKSATWKLRDKHFADFLSKEISVEDIDIGIENKRYGRQIHTCRGVAFLGAIDAICKAIPHTNEAAAVARRQMESMQHHFGCPTFFLTVTPDDDNHIVIQILTNTNLSGNKKVDEMTDDEIFNLSTNKTELRINFPGVCAYFFQSMLDIILKDVIGWDKDTNTRIDGIDTLFGPVDALTVTIEEQGRRTLHAHILIWVSCLNYHRQCMFTGTEHVQREATQQIVRHINHLCSTKFFFSDHTGPLTGTMCRKAFPHACVIERQAQRKRPKVVSPQQLRNLRCKRPYETTFAYCCDCNTTWSQTEFVSSYLQYYICVPGIGPDSNANARRLKCKTTEFQSTATVDQVAPSFMVDGAYNNHVHTGSCFKHKFDGDSAAALCDECRYRYPQLKKRRTTIQDVNSDTYPWYSWEGILTQRHIKEISVKRSVYDNFQNVCCPHISYSKFTCNTNLSFLLPGPVAQYCVSYTMKNTQKEETEEYELVRSATEKILSKTKTDDTYQSTAIRRLIGTSFAHQSNNVVGAQMASYLTRNKSRFYFSHTFSWCPLRDLLKLVNDEQISVTVTFTQYSAYYRSLSLNYLCRPLQLEHVSVYDFYSKYEVVTVTSNNKDSLLHFIANRHFQHPSYNPKTREFRQGLRERKIHTLPKIYQYDFPDTATFGGDIFCPATPINSYMEEYSQNALLLFCPFRSGEQLKLNDSYTSKLRQLRYSNHLHPRMSTFLQNLQDCKSNNFRNISILDELQRSTIAPTTTNLSCLDEDASLDNEDILHLNDINMNDENNDIDQHLSAFPEDREYENTIPDIYSCTTLRGDGRLRCGFLDLPNFSSTHLSVPDNFVIHSNTPAEVSPEDTLAMIRQQPSAEDIVTILLAHVGRHQLSFSKITGQPDIISVFEPNGSAKSIINWAEKSGLDIEQQRAFEVMTSSFVLSYYDSSTPCMDSPAVYHLERKKLRILAHNDKRKSNQLICFLHGPGGSGKTAVINLLMLYARTFCSYLWTDFQQQERVIVITALTGVAATLLQGETTHSALFLNQKKDITREQIQLWNHTKMIIIDEVSFAHKHDITMINSKLCKLKQQPFQRYGGIHVVFCGDFRQLEPVGANKKPIYSDNVPEFRDWINCYIELQGMWRFRCDLEWGRLLRRIREGEVTTEDINTINTHICKKNSVPAEIRYACYHNRDRDAINTAIFEERLKASYASSGACNGYIVIFSDNIRIQDNSKVYKRLNSPRYFWETFGENHLKMSNGTARMDPVLKLYLGCRLMLPTNIDVANGLANGTQATLQQVIFQEGERPSLTTISGIPVMAAFASQISALTLRHTNENHQPQHFHVSPKKHSFKVNNKKMQATQVPILLNNATTGHKLQGCGVDEIFVHNWSYVTNWIYVMLSRVKTMDGLYARKELSLDITKYKLPQQYKKMVAKLQKRQPELLSDDVYNILLHS